MVWAQLGTRLRVNVNKHGMKMMIKNTKFKRYKKLTGRCYEIAFRFIMDNPEWLLIHGELDLTFFLGQQYANYKHAWAKNKNAFFDPANNSIYQADEWEKFKPTEINVYSIKEAVLEATKHGLKKMHYGPWNNKTEE